MNQTANDEAQTTTAVEGPGGHLKAVREAEGLELARVAVLLHLSEEKLEALEADAYDRLPGPVFVQGYLRNYARLLGVRVEPILNAYHAANPSGNRTPELKVTRVRHEVGSGHALVRLVTWGIVVLLLGLVVVWWRGYLQWPVQLPGTGRAPQSENAEATERGAEPGMDSAQPITDVDASGEAALTLPTFEPEPEPAPFESEPEPEPAVPGVQPLTPPNPAVETSVDAEPVTTAPASALSEPPTPEAPAQATPRVVLEFSGTSWTKIEDASGEFRIEGQIKGGVRQALQGRPPYRLVLGNASVVRMLVDGEELDLAPYTRGNVARFTFDPDS